MKRTVTYARIHDIKVVIPGVGQLETEFPPQRKTLPGLKMSWDGAVLEIEISGKSYGIPAANIQFMTFAPEAPAAAVVAKAKVA